MKYISFILSIILFASCSQKESIKESNYDQVKLLLDDAAFDKIKAKRDSALLIDHLFKGPNDYVKGLLVIGSDSIEVKARLKGDHVDHLKGERWSFRIVSKKPNLFNHYKISIQGTETRNNMVEWIYHELLKNEGLIHLQYKFIPFSVNDTLKGIYAMESHFDNYLLDMSNRPYGPILKFDETAFWNHVKTGWKECNEDSILFYTPIKALNKKWVNESSDNREMTELAITILDEYRKGKRDFKTCFDLGKWKKFIAINELTGTIHGLRWHNIRFYYNPETKLIEPIGFDNGSWFNKNWRMMLIHESPELFYKYMFNDTSFYNDCIMEVKRMTQPSYLDNFLEPRKEEMKTLIDIIRLDKEDYKFWPQNLYKVQKRIIHQLDSLSL